MTPAVVVEELGIRFNLDRQRRPTTPGLTRLRRRCTTQWSLRGLSFTIEPGAGVGLIGPNGAGKTTLLRTLAGVLTPDEGRVVVRGRVGSLLSTNAGLMPSLTGRENSLLLGVLAGLPRSHARASIDSIKDRSGLGAVFEQPVSTYSQGMRARLGFAVIEQAEPDVLLLDEVHEAIDESFRQRLAARVTEVRARGGIVVAAGHDHAELSRFCDRALMLEKSGIRALDSVEDGAEMLARLAGRL